MRVKVLHFMPFTPLLCISFMLYNPTPAYHLHLCHYGFSIGFRGASREHWMEKLHLKTRESQTAARVVCRAKWWDKNRKGKERKVWGDLFLDTSDQAVRSALSSDVSLGVGV